VFWVVLVPAIAAAGFLGLSTLPSDAAWQQITNPMSAEMEHLAERIGFSEEGRALFADSGPQLLDSAEFLDTCVTVEDGTDAGADDGIEDEPNDGQLATVGCYYGNGAGFGQIAIFRPTDDRLADQTVVTAAHEFLHAVYAQLPPDDRAVLDPLLETRWSLVPADDPIQASLTSSVGAVGENRATEQFAYLGSEIADAGDPALEAFYAPYFVDRQAVVAINGSLLAMWDGLWADYQAKADALLIHEQADADAGAQLSADREQLDADRITHNRQVGEYNALTPQGRARLFVMNADGTLGDEAWGSYLERVLGEINTKEAGFVGRQAELDASVTAAQAERAAFDLSEADLHALNTASVPAAG